MEPAETFELAKYIDQHLGAKDNSGRPVQSIWQAELGSATIDEYGLIHAIVGDALIIKDRILNNHKNGLSFDAYAVANPGLDLPTELERQFHKELCHAAKKAYGERNADKFLDDFIEALVGRRSE